MLELRCLHIESSEYLCDRRAEYQIDGTVYCARHARRLMEASGHGVLKPQTKEAE
jgi:hypothetical protein